jgi:hypothetical protein
LKNRQGSPCDATLLTFRDRIWHQSYYPLTYGNSGSYTDRLEMTRIIEDLPQFPILRKGSEIDENSADTPSGRTSKTQNEYQGNFISVIGLGVFTAAIAVITVECIDVVKNYRKSHIPLPVEMRSPFYYRNY